MGESLALITPPAAEPVTVGDFKALLRIPLSDVSRDATLQGFITAARIDCENYCRIKLITQTWLLRTDSFPGSSFTYDRSGFPAFQLPFPPFQSVQFFKYVDTTGVVQVLTRDTAYGQDPAAPLYGYQVEQGDDGIPARLLPPWARPWAPQILVPANTMIQYRCGYGSPLTVSVTGGSAVLTSPGFKFNPDDAPTLVSDVGLKVCIPGAGDSGADLKTSVVSVDGNGVATLADTAAVDLPEVVAWIGNHVPEALKLSILFHAQFFHEQGAVVDAAVPRVVDALRSPYKNYVS